MAAMLLAGVILAVAMIMTMARLDLLKFLGYASLVDVLFTALMMEMFYGTFMGVVAGAFSGLCMTAGLYMLKYTLGYKRLQRVGLKIKWVYHPGKVREHVKAL